jgi:hypothetical protein
MSCQRAKFLPVVTSIYPQSHNLDTLIQDQKLHPFVVGRDDLARHHMQLSRLWGGTNIAAEAQSPKTRSRRCCETMIFVPSSFIRLSEPISRGSVTGQRNSRTRLRASCPRSRTSEHSSAGARGCDVRMFGCLPLDGPHREGGLLAGLRTYLPLSRTLQPPFDNAVHNVRYL